MFSRNSKVDYVPADYRISGKKLETILGPLEARVMEIMWEVKTPVSVRTVYEKLRKERKIAYTTVMSTMNTLFEKGLLDRKVAKGRGGLLYVYWPKLSKEEIERSVVKQVIDSLVRNFGDSVVSYLMEITVSNEEKLKALKRLFESLKREG